MAFTSSDLTELETAIKEGKLTVTVSGKSVTYRSIEDLIKARQYIKDELDRTSATNNGGSSLYSVADFTE